MKSLLLTVLGCIVLAYVAYGALAWEVPAAVVCDRGRPNVEVSSTAPRGFFETQRIGPCVTYTHGSRGPVGD
jgi:hypothetical protein